MKVPKCQHVSMSVKNQKAQFYVHRTQIYKTKNRFVISNISLKKHIINIRIIAPQKRLSLERTYIMKVKIVNLLLFYLLTATYAGGVSKPVFTVELKDGTTVLYRKIIVFLFLKEKCSF